MKKSKSNNEYPWYKNYNDIPPHLEYYKGSIVDYLKDTSFKNYPEYTAIEYFGRTWTFEEFEEEIKKCAKALKQIGVKEDDVVSICMPNTPQAIIMFYAVNMVGAISNMIHPLSSEKEIEFYLNKSKSSVILAIDIDYKKIIKIINNTIVKKIIITSASDEMPKFKATMYNIIKGDKTKALKKFKEVFLKFFRDREVLTWKKFMDNAYKYVGKAEYYRDANDPAVILYSGGTTGKPKGIVLSNLSVNALALQTSLMCKNSKPGDSVLNILPIFHGFGLGVSTHTCLMAGVKCILIPVFNPKKFGDLVKEKQPSFLVGVPTLFESLTKSITLGKKDLACVHSLVCGGDLPTEPARIRINKFFKDHGSSAELRVGYGLTEACAAVAFSPLGAYKPGTVGIPLPDIIIKIVKTGTHDEANVMEDGEICVTGPNVMQGYLDEVSETMQVLRKHEDGKIWLHTGDIGCMDEDGYVYFKSRLKRVIVTNGYNVYPNYLEEKINMHKDVLTSTVIGVDDKYRGQKVKAFIVLKDGIKPTEEVKKSIMEHCEKYISKYAIPKEIEYRTDLPKTAIGKVAYRDLEDEEKSKK